jgi:vesicle transport through interaction with t-SNAREs protein 1
MFSRLLDNSESLERSSRKLDQGQELLTETEAIGASVLNDLEHQKEVLFRSRNRVRARFSKYFL